MNYSPTAEQAAIIDTVAAGRNAAVVAGAGTGKTSTLVQAAAALGARSKVLYAAFNKAAATDAAGRFGRNTTVKTTTALAYAGVGYRYRARLNANRVPGFIVAKRLGITTSLAVDAVRKLRPSYQGSLIVQGVERFCNSTDPEPRAWCIPAVPGIDDDQMAGIRASLLPYVARAWEEMQDPNGGDMPFGHHVYVKLWAMSEPVLPYDVILYDEAQDANRQLANILTAQDAQLVVVGDPAQSLYEWRGAINIMDEFCARAQTLALTESFRFAQVVADLANTYLAHLGSTMRLVGRGGPSTRGAVDPAGPQLILCRTNARAAVEAIDLLDDADTGDSVGIVGGGGQILAIADAADQLMAGRSPRRGELQLFDSWSAVQDFAEHEAAGADLRPFVRLVDKHGTNELRGMVRSLVSEDRARYRVATVHKTKGLECEQVRIADDFPVPRVADRHPDDPPNEEEDYEVYPSAEDIRCAYVAVTRARHRLDAGVLAWGEQYPPLALATGSAVIV